MFNQRLCAHSELICSYGRTALIRLESGLLLPLARCKLLISILREDQKVGLWKASNLIGPLHEPHTAASRMRLPSLEIQNHVLSPLSSLIFIPYP